MWLTRESDLRQLVQRLAFQAHLDRNVPRSMWPDKDINQPATCSLISLRCLHEYTLHPRLTEMHPVKILNLRWSHMSEGTFSDVAAHLEALSLFSTLMISHCFIFRYPQGIKK